MSVTIDTAIVVEITRPAGRKVWLGTTPGDVVHSIWSAQRFTSLARAEIYAEGFLRQVSGRSGRDRALKHRVTLREVRLTTEACWNYTAEELL